MNDGAPVSMELGAMDIAEILNSLPHRYPFLMIDKIVRIDRDEKAVGIKHVTFNEPIFMGHFPGNPIFPGVLIIEGMAQTAGAIVIKHDTALQSDPVRKNIVMMLGVDKARFRKPTGPGNMIEFHIQKIQRRRDVGRYGAKAIVDGAVIAEAEITAMIMEADS